MTRNPQKIGTTTERPWRVFAHREPPAVLGSPEAAEEARVLSAIGYRGMSSYETEDEAYRAAVGLRERLGASAPRLGWRVVWFGPETIMGANERHLGSCRVLSWVRGEEDDGAGSD